MRGGEHHTLVHASAPRGSVHFPTKSQLHHLLHSVMKVEDDVEAAGNQNADGGRAAQAFLHRQRRSVVFNVYAAVVCGIENFLKCSTFQYSCSSTSNVTDK